MNNSKSRGTEEEESIRKRSGSSRALPLIGPSLPADIVQQQQPASCCSRLEFSELVMSYSNIRYLSRNKKRTTEGPEVGTLIQSTTRISHNETRTILVELDSPAENRSLVAGGGGGGAGGADSGGGGGGSSTCPGLATPGKRVCIVQLSSRYFPRYR
ncbi:hypothetical protein M0802_013373 [Mischocyttarus mexicanus]|nr:hypothetical protein M0802_013373 [Mischocyttarus mexicanus]